jgi:DNA-binding NarL/FixJ family response regulator
VKWAGFIILVHQAGEDSMSAKILIVDDHYVVRQGVRSILAERPEWEICGEAATGEEAVDAAATLRPDVVILDVTMPASAASTQPLASSPSAPARAS